MPSLRFRVDDAAPVRFAAVPTIGFRLKAEATELSETIQGITLQIQIRIEARKREYNSAERAGMRDLFGDPDLWSKSLHSLLWTHERIAIPKFTGSTTVEIPVPASFDFNVAAAKYFHAAEQDDIPLVFQFSGTVFRTRPGGDVHVEPIGWDQESRYRLKADVWRGMMDVYYPNSAWLRLDRDVFDRLHRYKQSIGTATWEQAIESLLPPLKKEAAS